MLRPIVRLVLERALAGENRAANPVRGHDRRVSFTMPKAPRLAVVLLVAYALVGVVATTPAAGDLVSRPSIENESASSITPTNATLEAQINPGGLETTYEFRLETPTCQMMEGPGPVRGCVSLGTATISAGSTTQNVTINIADAWHELTPNSLYLYFVRAVNSAGEAYGDEKEFRTSTAPQEGPSITSESVSRVTPTDATLEAAIEPRAWEGAYYQFQIVKDPSEYSSEILCPPPPWDGYSGCVGTQSKSALPIGWVCGKCETALAAHPVQLDLAGAGVTLEPSMTYHYRVIAARAVKTEDTIQWEPPVTYGADQIFSTLPLGATPQSNKAPSTTSGGSQLAISSAPTGSSVLAVAPLLGSPPVNVTQLEPLTKAQRLSRALRACAKKSKSKRAACRKHAREKYGAAAKRRRMR